MAASARELIPEELVTEDRLRDCAILVVERTEVIETTTAERTTCDNCGLDRDEGSSGGE